MNIAWIVPGGVDRSGTQRVIPALLWLLERVAREHRVTVVALAQEPTPAEWELHGARVINIGAGLRRLRAARRLIAEHRRARFDVIHAFWASGPGGVGDAVSRLTRVPLVVHVAGGELVALADIAYGGGLRWRTRLEVASALRRAAAVTAASGPIARLVEAQGVTCEMVPLGVDARAWPPLAPRPRAVAEPLRLVHVGSLNAVKNQALLIEAAAALAARGIAFTLDVVGQDTQGGALQRAAASRGLTQIAWHGFRTQAETRPLVERAHLFVLTSRHEAGPVAVLEAAMAGVAVVGTSVGHVADLAPGAMAAIAAPDATALADTIAALAADDARRLALAGAAQRWAVDHDADWTNRAVQAIYRRVTA